MVQLAALVITHNRLDQLRVTVAALLSSKPEVLGRLVIVDNASTDGTSVWLSEQADPRIDVLSLDRNSGGAGGFAAGLAHVTKVHDPEWTVLMDDDARPEAGCLDTFVVSPRDGNDAWFAAVRLPDGTIADMNRPWLNPFWHPITFLRSLVNGRDGFHLSQADYANSQSRPVDGGSFVGVFLSRRAIELAGEPDAGLFLYGDDVLYTLGLTAAGGRASFDPTLRFVHDCGTLSGPGPVFIPIWKAYYFHRNQLLVYARAAGPVLFWPIAFVKWLRWRSRAPAYGADRGFYLRALGAAMRDGLAGRTDRSHDDVLSLTRGSAARGDTAASEEDPAQ